MSDQGHPKQDKIEPFETGEKQLHFKDAKAAYERVLELYMANTQFLKQAFGRYVSGETPESRVRACYPYVRVSTDKAARVDNRYSYGFVPKPGVYSTTLTRPDLFDFYYKKQFELLLQNHGGELEVGVSDSPIPIHFALGENFHLEEEMGPERLAHLPYYFDLPDLTYMDDKIANATHQTAPGEDAPLALFTAPRVDVSLQRLKHYTGTCADHFQNFVLYTNYQFYVDEFIELGQILMAKTDDKDEAAKRCEYTEFVEPGEWVTPNQNLVGADEALPQASGRRPARQPQMPAYHLKRADGNGITLINIGVGPSNAKTITDHVAVLRPHAWIMLGHCAGLRNSQSLGDYVLAHAYMREDQVLDSALPLWVPLPALAEIQVALEQAVSSVTGLEGYELKKVMRTGTVATIDDRNWELREHIGPVQRLSQSRAIALDMESATIAANGFRFRVPYGTLLCVSDKPLHGQLKLPGMADSFYRQRVDQHLKIGVQTMECLREMSHERLHSRKLRSFNEVAFQ